jgi:hypothetical protein
MPARATGLISELDANYNEVEEGPIEGEIRHRTDTQSWTHPKFTRNRKTEHLPVPGEEAPPIVDGSGSHAFTYKKVMDSVRRVPEGRDNAGYGSVYDVIRMVTGKDANQAGETWRNVANKADQDGSLIYPGWKNLPKAQFDGMRQRETPVAPLKTLLQIVQVVPGVPAAQFRIHCSEMLCRVFAGDPNLEVDLAQNRSELTPQDRRDLLREVPGAAPVDDALMVNGHVHDSELSTSLTQSASPTLPAIAFDGNDGCNVFPPECLFHIAGNAIFKTEGLKMLKAGDVPPGFGSTQVFYVQYHGAMVSNGKSLFKVGWSDDYGRRAKDNCTVLGPGAIVALVECGLFHSKKAEDAAKTQFKSMMTNIRWEQTQNCSSACATSSSSPSILS